MKVLVKQNNSVLEESKWDLKWVKDDGFPLTEPCWGYALCEIPDELDDLTVWEDYDFSERVEVITEDEQETTKVYLEAVFNMEKYEARPKEEIY